MIETLKGRMLEILEQVADYDAEKTPSYYFLMRFKAALQVEAAEVVPDPGLFAADVLSRVKVNFMGLGLSAEGHEDFLKTLAESYAKIVVKTYKATHIPFGHECALNLVTSDPIKFA
jgi:hypothetical protein